MDWLQAFLPTAASTAIIFILVSWFKEVRKRFSGYDQRLDRVDKNMIELGQDVVKISTEMNSFKESVAENKIAIAENKKKIGKLDIEIKMIKVLNPNSNTKPKKITLLIVDDDEDNAELLQDRFNLKTENDPRWKHLTFDIDIANTYNGAIKKLNNGKDYDIAIIDIHLDGKNTGWGVSKYCYKNKTRLRVYDGQHNIIHFTADDNIKTVPADMAHGFVKINRPTSTEEFKKFDDLLYMTIENCK